MASISAQLRGLRQQVEALQVEVAGRQHIGSMVIWDQQNQDSVNHEVAQIQEGFSGLVVHLTPELSAQAGTVAASNGIDQDEFNALKKQLLDEQSIRLGEVIS